jgi:hypothetical protein
VASFTPRVGLFKPEDDGSDPVNVATDLNDNMEKLDTVIGFVPSTVASPPATPFDGQATYETDTGRAKFRKASVWNYLLAAGASFLSNIYLDSAYRFGIGTGTPGAIFDVAITSATAVPFMKLKQFSEAQPRIQFDHDGLRIGGGSVAPEVRIYRPASNQLSIVGGVAMSSTLSVAGDTALEDLDVSGNLSIGGSVTTNLNVTGDFSATGTGYTQVIRKTADATRTSTTTTTTDPEMLVALAANTNYVIELYLMFSGVAGDFKLAWNIPAGCSIFRWSLGPDVGAASNSNITMRSSIHIASSEPGFGTFSDTSWMGAKETIIVFNGATAGDMQLKWAQNTSSANVSTLRAGTFMMVRKID